jgi:hypothetical protein
MVIPRKLHLTLLVLERDFSLPISVSRGFIKELRIHVPWTALTSEPIEVFSLQPSY